MPDDNFNDNSIGAEWTTSTPAGSVTESSEKLNISIGSTVNGAWDATNENAPIIYQTVPSEDYFEVIVKVNNYTYTTDTHVGILLYKDRNNAYLFGPRRISSSNYIYLSKIVSGSYTSNVANVSSSTIPIYLRIRYEDETWYFDSSTDGSAWTNRYSTATLGFTPTDVGMFARNLGAYPATDVSFEDFIIHYGPQYEALVEVNPEDYDDWLWENEVTITGSPDGQLTNYVVNITVPYDSEFMQSNFGDIRFGLDTGEQLYYFLRQKVDGDFAEFMVKIPVIPASPDGVTIYLYSGNPSVYDRSDGYNTFGFFDHFDTGIDPVLNTGKWTASGSGGDSIADSVLTLFGAAGGTSRTITSTSNFGQNYVCGVRAKFSGGSWSAGYIGFSDGSDYWIREKRDYRYSKSVFLTKNNDTEEESSDHDSTYPPGDYHVYEITNRSVGGIFEVIDFDDDDPITSTKTISTSMPVKLVASGYGASMYTYIDYVYVRSVVTNEPTIGELGSWATTTHSDTFQSLLYIPYYNDFQTLLCIRPLNEDFQALINILGYGSSVYQALLTVHDYVEENYYNLYQALFSVNENASNSDFLVYINVGHVQDGRMEVKGVILRSDTDEQTVSGEGVGYGTPSTNQPTAVIMIGDDIYV